MIDWIIIGLLVLFMLALLFWLHRDPYVRNVTHSYPRNSRNRRVDRELY